MQVVQIQNPYPPDEKHKAANFPKKSFFHHSKPKSSRAYFLVVSLCQYPVSLPPPLNLHFDFRSSRFQQKSWFYLPTWHRPCSVHSCENPTAPNLYKTLITACLDTYFPLWVMAPLLHFWHLRVSLPFLFVIFS